MIVDVKHEKSYLNKVMKEQYQHLTENQWKYVHKQLQHLK